MGGDGDVWDGGGGDWFGSEVDLMLVVGWEFWRGGDEGGDGGWWVV